jgi:hypothetical protein
MDRNVIQHAGIAASFVPSCFLDSTAAKQLLHVRGLAQVVCRHFATGVDKEQFFWHV